MRVCVIGAGPSGLTTIKQLLDEGHNVRCFEKSDDIGGIWYRHAREGDDPKAYDELFLSISAKLMAFSDFIPPGERIFYRRAEYLEYLHRYADEYALRPRICFSTEVVALRRVGTGAWRIGVRNSEGALSYEVFEAIAICSGPFRLANRDVSDIGRFTGEVLHSSEYRNSERFRGRRVLVVGLAESGADVVRQICGVASECVLVLRSYPFLLPRLFSGVHATDTFTTRAHHFEAFVRTAHFRYPGRALFGGTRLLRVVSVLTFALYGIVHVLLREVARTWRRLTAQPLPEPVRRTTANALGEPMLPLKIDLETEWNQEHMDAIHEWNRRSHAYRGNWSPKAIFCKNVSFIPDIVSGRLRVNDTGIDAVSGNVVTFGNGQKKQFDTIVLCTGFRHDFSLLGPDLVVPDNNVRNLYKHAFFPEHHGSAALIGFVRPFSGGIPICAEMQARYFAQLCSRNLKLPADVALRIDRERVWEERLTTLSQTHLEATPSQILFLDDLAKEIGCLLPMWRLALRPMLLIRHWFFPFNQACYRLTGPHDMHAKASQELSSERAGPIGSSGAITRFALASLLPSFIHPKDISLSALPGQPRPPGIPRSSRDHFLFPRDDATRQRMHI